MQRIEYRTIDKSQWGDGPWQNEPDKIQWQDEETGLPCLIVRGQLGALCGYVGVKPGHRLYQKEYSGCPDARDPEQCPACKGDGYSYCKQTPESVLDAHGGITFTGPCNDEPTEAAWRRAQERFIKAVDEAEKYPRGDAAEFVREWGGCLKKYEDYVANAISRSICYLPDLRDKDAVWWFGFDCAHSGDMSPKMMIYASASYRETFKDEPYRDIAYVTSECLKLAKQLKAME